MRTLLRLVALLLLVVAAACDSPTATRAAALAGDWIGPTYTWSRDDAGPRAERRYLLLADGEVFPSTAPRPTRRSAAPGG